MPRVSISVLQQGRGEKYLTEAFGDFLYLTENFIAKAFEYDITMVGVLERETARSFSFFFRLSFFAYGHHIKRTKVINMLL